MTELFLLHVYNALYFSEQKFIPSLKGGVFLLENDKQIKQIN